LKSILIPCCIKKNRQEEKSSCLDTANCDDELFEKLFYKKYARLQLTWPAVVYKNIQNKTVRF